MHIQVRAVWLKSREEFNRFQKLFVIIAFSEHHVEKLVSIIGDVPYIGQALQAPFKDFLAKQKASLHGKAAGAVAVLLWHVPVSHFSTFLYRKAVFLAISSPVSCSSWFCTSC